jgi:hypothetical protein
MRRFLLLVSLLAICVGALMNGALFTGIATASEPIQKYKNPDVSSGNSLANAIDSAHKFRSGSGKLSSQKKNSGLKSAHKSSKSKKYGKHKSSHSKKYAKAGGKYGKKYSYSKKKAGKKTASSKTNVKKKSHHKKAKPLKKAAYRN